MLTFFAVALPLFVIFLLRSHLRSAWGFVYATFLSPQIDDDNRGANPQAFFEHKYKDQGRIYDETRSFLLPGREAMLGLLAAQLLQRSREQPQVRRQKPIWVDIGGGTGYTIEAMSRFLPVPDFFSQIYLLDFTPSLLEIARERFARLGWTNVYIICADASHFRLRDYVQQIPYSEALHATSEALFQAKGVMHADLITLSYSLSTISEFFPVVDMLTSLLSPTGVVGVTDFYVQNNADVASRNYTAGFYKRHLSAMKRMFWRAWFDLDRINLDSSRRDYLEYKFGSILNINCWKYHRRVVPYYIWIGCNKKLSSASFADSSDFTRHEIQRLNAIATVSSESIAKQDSVDCTGHLAMTKTRSKVCEAALMNLALDLPLPAYYYQGTHWRLPYDESLEKFAAFVPCTSPFTWNEGGRDQDILNITNNDVILALTSGGDNILKYATQRPKQIHAVDRNPMQNHALELKLAAYSSLDHSSLSSLLCNHNPASFCQTLISKLSPHLSSRALQCWLHHAGLHSKRHRTPIISCHAALLEEDTFRKLVLPQALEGVVIHTKELEDTFSQIAPGSLTIAVVMNSMDELLSKDKTRARILALRHILQPGGRVLLHSKDPEPSYVTTFNESGFRTDMVASQEAENGYA